MATLHIAEEALRLVIVWLAADPWAAAQTFNQGEKQAKADEASRCGKSIR